MLRIILSVFYHPYHKNNFIKIPVHFNFICNFDNALIQTKLSSVITNATFIVKKVVKNKP